MRITSKMKNDFSSNSSGSKYYDTKGEAVSAFNDSLEPYGLCLNFADCNDWHYDEGRRTVAILTLESDSTESKDTGKVAIMTWYRMGTGRWEIIGYIG